MPSPTPCPARACAARWLLAALPLLVAGCRKPPAAVAPVPTTKAPPQVSQADIKRYQPNEAGAIMIVMYHRMRASEPSRDLNRPPALFRKDLETLYARGYYPVNLFEIVSNKLDVPAGKTPVALTFDDSLPSQFHIITGTDGRDHIDPDCTVGILESFNKAHPDWPLRGTFFVLPHEGKNGFPFGQAESVSQKFAYLSAHGYEIGNHTSTHSQMHGMKAAQVRWELATAVRDIKQIDKDAGLNLMALPEGRVPRDKEARAALMQGEDGGTKYRNKAVVLAAWRPILAPMTLNDRKLSEGGTFCVYDTQGLERVVPDSRKPKMAGTFEYWLNYFQTNPGTRYVSDGNKLVCTVPPSAKSSIDPQRLRSSGQVLQVYGEGGPGDKEKGGALSVQ